MYMEPLESPVIKSPWSLNDRQITNLAGGNPYKNQEIVSDIEKKCLNFLLLRRLLRSTDLSLKQIHHCFSYLHYYFFPQIMCQESPMTLEST